MNAGLRAPENGRIVTEQHLPNTAPEKAEPAARTLLAVALRRARWTILWERLWPALATLATALGLFLALSWLGLWLWLPPLARAVGVIGFVVAIVAALIPLGLLRMPAMREGLSRLDRGSGLAHRPATAIADELAVTSKDPYSLALWNAHVERALAAARALKAGTPAPRVAWRDPYALRALVLLACIATFFAAGGERWKRVAAAFDWQGVVLPANFRVDAWVVPPAYTGKPPLVLPGIHPGDTATAQAPGDGPFAVPVNSTLIVRSTGNVNLDISGTGGVTPSKEAAQAPAGTEEHRFTITATGTATLRGAGDDLTWPFNAIPDNPPTIALDQGSASAEPRLAAFVLPARRRLRRDGRPRRPSRARTTPPRRPRPAKSRKQQPHPLYGPPQFPLVLPQARTKNGVGQTIKDLTDHPWAGAEVTMTLVAHDEGGNVGKSDPVTFRLPQRVFIKPLARALIEQRRDLAMDANARPQVITALDALAIAPEKFTPDAGVYLGLRSIFWSLVRAKTDDDLRDVVTRLWQMAVDIEDGNMSDAQDALRNAENALQQALARGAGDDEIKQLMDKLREAMERYMQALAQQLKNNQQLAASARPQYPGDDASATCRTCSIGWRTWRAAAPRTRRRQLLQQLAADDGKPADGVAGHERRRERRMMSELDELGDMIRQQQDLRDRTFKQGQNQNQNQDQQDAQRGQQGKPGPSAASRRFARPIAAEPAGAARPAQQIARRSEEPRARPEPARPGRPAGAGAGPERQSRRRAARSARPRRRRHGRGRRRARRGQRRQRGGFARPRARRLAQGRAVAGAIDAAADGAGQRPGPRPLRPGARRQRHRSARPSAARPRIQRRLLGQGAGRHRRAARAPHHRGIAQALRRIHPPAGRARLPASGC